MPKPTLDEVESQARACGITPRSPEPLFPPASSASSLFSDAEGHNVLMGRDGKVYPIDLIPETDLSPMRVQQVEQGVEGWKRIQQDTH